MASSFKRDQQPTGVQPCSSPCKAAKGADSQLSLAVQKRIESFTGRPEPASGLLATDKSPSLISADTSPCQKRAMTLGPTLRRFNRYNAALPYARAASDMNNLGDDPKPPNTDEPKQPKGPCLTRLPVNSPALCRALGLPPGTLKDGDMRNDTTGFRAAMYRDESNGTLILVPRDTQPKSLVDWQTNTRNGDGKFTEQYASIRELSIRFSNENVAFDVAGYSKGGGMAQEAALYNPTAKAFVFNSAGIPDVSAGRNGNVDIHSLGSRTSAFSAENDFLTDMNNTKDPELQIENVKFLQRELEGKNRCLVAPMKIDHRSPELSSAQDDPSFSKELSNYLSELDDKIKSMEASKASGQIVHSFPPVRAGQQETIPGKSQNSSSDGPNLGKLAQHQMKNVLDPMEKAVEKDKHILKNFLACCG